MSEKSDWEQGYDQAMMRTYGERKALKARIAELEAENERLSQLLHLTRKSREKSAGRL